MELLNVYINIPILKLSKHLFRHHVMISEISYNI